MKYTIVTVLILVLSLSTLELKAQPILVMLKSERNRVSFFERKGNTAEAKQVRSDAKGAMTATINDFTDHYSYSKVYYFIDTNLALIKEKKLEGVLLDKELKPILSAQLPKSHYLIVHFGIPEIELRDEGIAPTERNVHRSVRYPGKGLVVHDENYKLVKKPDIHFVYEPEIGSAIRGQDERYNFYSRDYDINYRELAKLLQNTLSHHPLNLSDKK